MDRNDFKPEEGSMFVAVRPLDHGDWKTALVHKDRWPTLKEGTEVKFVKEFTNFYGKWWTVESPAGESYDVEPFKLEEK
jgi:hypothetical protein